MGGEAGSPDVMRQMSLEFQNSAMQRWAMQCRAMQRRAMQSSAGNAVQGNAVWCRVTTST